MLPKFFTKLLCEKGLFTARFPVKRYPGQDYRDQSAHFARSDSRPKQREQNPCIDRMANGAIRPRAYQLVALFEGDNPAPIGSQMPAGPKRDRHACSGKKNSAPLR